MANGAHLYCVDCTQAGGKMNSMSNVNVLLEQQKAPLQSVADGEIINSVFDHYSSIMMAATLLVLDIQRVLDISRTGYIRTLSS